MKSMFGRNKGKKGNYAYVVARVKAKKAQLMSDDAYQKMLLMSLPEISRFISESGYQKEITDLTAKFDPLLLYNHVRKDSKRLVLLIRCSKRISAPLFYSALSLP